MNLFGEFCEKSLNLWKNNQKIIYSYQLNVTKKEKQEKFVRKTLNFLL